MLAENLALRVGSWRQKSQRAIVGDLASAAIEQRQAPLEERINPVLINFDDFKKLQQGLSWETSTSQMENAAYFKILQWAKHGEDGFLLWISPSSRQYPESRFVVYQLFFGADGKKALKIWSICERNSADECLEIANKLQVFSTNAGVQFRNPEKLRAEVMVFKAIGSLSWDRFLARFFGSPEIWQAIASGQAEAMKQRTLVEAEEVVAKYFKAMQAGGNGLSQLQLGAAIESEMEKRLGIFWQRVGSCGWSNQAILEWMNKGKGVLTALAEKAEGGRYVKKCPYCHFKIEKVINSGYRCPKCGRVYSGRCG